MMTRRTFLAASGAAAALGYSRTAFASDPVRIGQQPLKLGSDRDGVLYVPKNYTADVATPMVLMFHGAGGTGMGVNYTFEVADELGIIVLAPDSRDEATWDFLVHGYGKMWSSSASRCATPMRGAMWIGSGWRSPGIPTARRTRCHLASAPAIRSGRLWPSHPA